jgi:hypothetical protein
LVIHGLSPKSDCAVGARFDVAVAGVVAAAAALEVEVNRARKSAAPLDESSVEVVAAASDVLAAAAESAVRATVGARRATCVGVLIAAMT